MATTDRVAGSDATATRRGWLVSPQFDLLALSNLWWIAAAWPGWLMADGTSSLEFWQVYFLSTPHRWLTLLLVATDVERRTERPRRLVVWAVGILGCIVLVRAAGYSITCLLVVDYLWNAWHFGAQHGGILRIYSRLAGPPAWRWEAWAMRLMVPYTSLRLAGWTTGWVADASAARTWLGRLDLLVVALAAAWCAHEWMRWQTGRSGKVIYATSVISIYGLLLLAIERQAGRWIATLVVASAAFHAIEYLALVSYYAARRRSDGAAGAFQRLARQWPLVLGLLLVSLAALGLAADRRWPEAWLAINLWVAFLHYAYDGMIWKLRQPATAARLAVDR